MWFDVAEQFPHDFAVILWDTQHVNVPASRQSRIRQSLLGGFRILILARTYGFVALKMLYNVLSSSW
jgi:hypothetical protein